MHIAIIVGSHRKDSQSSRVGEYIAKDLASIDSSVTVDTIDLAGNPLPLWDESVWQGDSQLAALWKPCRDRMRKADGFVIISPEWAGMVPPGLKNVLLFAGPKEVGHKPALIVAVSASRGGSAQHGRCAHGSPIFGHAARSDAAPRPARARRRAVLLHSGTV